MVKIIAIDLGGTNLRVGLVENNKIKNLIQNKTPKEKTELLILLKKSISELIQKEGIKEIKGIGMGCPGPLEKGIIKNTPNLPLKNFNLKKFLKKEFNLPIEIENDANCVALAEAKLGCKKNNFFILTLGTGIGGGIILNGKIYSGKGLGGELGHIILDEGRDIETLWKAYRKLNYEYFRKDMLIKDLLKTKDKRSEEILSGLSDILAQGIVSLTHIFDPEIVVLSGGAKEGGSKFLNKIKKDAEKYMFLPRKIKLKWTKFKHPGVIGASLLLD